MEPTKQNQGGKPFGRGANKSYSPEQQHDLLPFHQAERGMALPQGVDVFGDSSARVGIHGVGNIGGYNTLGIPRHLAGQRPSALIPNNSQYRHPPSSGHRPGSFAHFPNQAGDVVDRAALFPAHGSDVLGLAALFPAHGGDIPGRPAVYDTSLDLDPDAAAHLAAQTYGQPAATSFDQRWQSTLSSIGAHQRHPSSTNFPHPGTDNGSIYQYTSSASLSDQPATPFNQPYPAENWQSMPNASQRHPSTSLDLDPASRIRQKTRLWLFDDKAGAQSRSRAPAVSTPEELRRLLLDDQDNANLVMNPDISKPIASLLDQGGQEDHHTAVRIAVLSRITSDVHSVMASDAGAEVFVALLRAIVRASKSKRLELNAIIQAAASPNARSRLMGVANQKPGVLKELFRVVAQIDRPELCEPLVNCLIDGWIMEQRNGPEQLHGLFSTLALPYQYCTPFIRRLAIPRFREMVTSEFGWISMVVCLRNARNDELTDLEQTVLNDTFEIAKSQFGCRFLQEVLKGDHRYYRPQLRTGIRERVDSNLIELSIDQFGNCVVQACIVALPTALHNVPHQPLLHRELAAFMDLTNDQLFALARNRYASHVLRKLLDTSKDHPAVLEMAVNLARRIHTALQGTGEDVMDRQMMQVIRDVLSKDHPQSPRSPPPPPSPPPQQQELVRNRLLTNVLEPGDLDFAGSSAHVARLLLESEEHWYDTVRGNVFKGIMRDLCTFMESREWHAVFLQFLRPDRLDDLQVIVDAICSDAVPVMRIVNSECGEASLVGLVRVLARLPCGKQFINYLLSKGLMEQRKGSGLLQHIFTEFPYEDSSICIRRAIDAFNGDPLSKFMLDSIWICLQAATGVDFDNLEKKILSNTAWLAEGASSHLFLKDILGSDGDSKLKEGIANHIVEHFASLSLNRYGHSLVVECFQRTGSLLERVLEGFLGLSDDQLVRLVNDRHGCYVIRMLLLAAKKDYPDETETLAVWSGI